MALLDQLRLWLPAYPQAKLFCYLAGTSTKTPVYTTPALSVAHANPVVSDVNGLFAAMWPDPTKSYDFVLAPSTDTDPPTAPLWTTSSVTQGITSAQTVLSVTADRVIAEADGANVTVLVDTTLGNITVTPVTAVGHAGYVLRVVKIAGNNTVTVDPSGSELVEGVSTFATTTIGEGAAWVSDGTQWHRVHRVAANVTVLAKTATYSVLATDGDDVLVLADATAGTVTINLYSAVNRKGRRVRVKRTDATGGNFVLVDPNASETVDAATSYAIRGQYAMVEAVSDGTNWQIVSSRPRDVVASTSISGGVLTLNLAAAQVFQVAMSANVTSVVIQQPHAAPFATEFSVVLTADGTARTWAFGSASHKTPGGITFTPSSTNGKKDWLAAVSDDGGTTYYWFISGQNY